MNTVSLNNLWSYLQGLSLSASNKRWLGEKLIEASNVKTKASEKDYKLEKLNSLYGAWAGQDGKRIEQAMKEAHNAGYERIIESFDE